MPHKNNTWRGGHKSRQSSFHQGILAWELHELLEIPRTVKKSSGGFRYERPELGQKIIQTIVKTMTSALQREEEISIPGFGRFRVETRKVRAGGTIQAVQSNGDIIGRPIIAMPHAPKKYVIFYPSPHLSALINQENPNVLNAKQRKAMKTWKPVNGN